tara:strand:- start:314 stop:1135 length:822 start_codon:yes stop_codon:yes gene_type:complete
MSAVLSVKTNLVAVPAYDYEINNVDLGGGVEYTESGSDIIPSGGTLLGEPMDTWYAGDSEATFGIGVVEVGGSDVTSAVVGSTITFTMNPSGLTNVPLTFAPNTTSTTKEFNVTVSGTGTTAILPQVGKTANKSFTPYTTSGTGHVTNRYKQLGNANVSISVASSGFDELVTNTHIDKTVKPLLPISGKQVGFAITRQSSGSGNTAVITGDIFYEKMGYKDKSFTIDFSDWFDYSANTFAPKSTLPSSVLDTTNTVGAVVTIKNLVPTLGARG